MPDLRSLFSGLFTAAAIAGLSSAANAAERTPVVVELFTSQGCSSCPPANANLIKLSRQPNVLALSFAVTYWDYLGWKDSFGKPEFTNRQAVYEPPLGQQGPFTPQMVVNGKTTAVGNDLGEVEQLISNSGPLAGPMISLGKNHVKIDHAGGRHTPADVWLVRYDPNVVKVSVARGENTGETLAHTHVVHLLKRLGTWKGIALSYDIPDSAGTLKTAILVQQQNGGPILSAATN
jgi:hypothetical protein